MMSVLQSTLGSDISGSCWFSGDALSCLLATLVSGFGGPNLFGLLMGATLFVAFYVASDGSIAVPTVALILSGTVILPLVPGNYQSIAGGVVLIGLAAALWGVIKQYVLSGAAR